MKLETLPSSSDLVSTDGRLPRLRYSHSERSCDRVRDHVTVWEIMWPCERSCDCVRDHVIVWEIALLWSINGLDLDRLSAYCITRLLYWLVSFCTGLDSVGRCVRSPVCPFLNICGECWRQNLSYTSFHRGRFHIHSTGFRGTRPAQGNLSKVSYIPSLSISDDKKCWNGSAGFAQLECLHWQRDTMAIAAAIMFSVVEQVSDSLHETIGVTSCFIADCVRFVESHWSRCCAYWPGCCLCWWSHSCSSRSHVNTGFFYL